VLIGAYDHFDSDIIAISSLDDMQSSEHVEAAGK
jgi:hypothetical protein